MTGPSIILVIVLSWKTCLLFVHISAMWSRVVFQSQISSHSQSDAVPIMIKSKHQLTLPETMATFFHFFYPFSFLFFFFAFPFFLFFSLVFSKLVLKESPGNARENAFLSVSKVQIASLSGSQFCKFLDSFSPLAPLARFPKPNMLVGVLLCWELMT